MSEKRTRKLTVKGMAMYEEQVFSYNRKLEASWKSLERLTKEDTRFCESSKLEDIHTELSRKLDEYNSLYDRYCEFLCDTKTTEANERLHELSGQHKQIINSVTNFRDSVTRQKQLVTGLGLFSSVNSKNIDNTESVASRSSTSSRAKAAAAQARLHIAEQEAALQKKMSLVEEQKRVAEAAANRQKVDLEIELQLLKQKKEAAEVLAEADALEEDQLYSTGCENPSKKVTAYLQNMKTETHLNPEVPTFNSAYQVMERETEHSQINQFSQFLLKKEILLSRFTKFDDQAESFLTWKNTFNSIMKELNVTPFEQLDLLVKWLGPNSSKQATTIRSANAGSPEKGLARIWQRLEDQFGCPEIIEQSIRHRIANFPKLTVSAKDNKRLYELSDLLFEIESLKENDLYAAMFSHYDCSTGVKPIVAKLSHGMQERWTVQASNYKTMHGVAFPPFTYFVQFVRTQCKMKNDPSFSLYDSPSYIETSRFQTTKRPGIDTRSMRTDVEHFSNKGSDLDQTDTGQTSSIDRCPIHRANHSLLDCRTFKSKSVFERKKLAKECRLCFRCLETNTHRASDCKKQVRCDICKSDRHNSVMHEQGSWSPGSKAGTNPHVYGGEGTNSNGQQVESRCTQICGNSSLGAKSCAKIVLVDIFCSSSPSNKLRTYAIIDDQSNRSLAKPELFSRLNIDGTPSDYTLYSCSGPCIMNGRKAYDCVVEAVDGMHSYLLPPLLECSEIPNARDDIPTPEIASHFNHLQDIASEIPAFDESADILLLIGRDLSAAHHVHDQIIGSYDSPFAQRLGLGWVVVGQVCLGKVHHSDVVSCNRTNVLINGRPSVFPPCVNNFHIKEKMHSSIGDLGENLFLKTEQDNMVGLSVEDREFLTIMDKQMQKGPSGNWVTPLPFRSPRPKLPNNRSYALTRAFLLHKSLLRDPKKREHFVTFMDQIIGRGHAEVAPEIPKSKESWYLPLFGVYHPKKPDQIRGVFDASAKFQGISLNDVLLQGPDLLNNLLGILLRFRKNAVAISADIQQMFYSFLVDKEDRDYLRFFWYPENDLTKNLIEYRMRVHVFGNRPSPAVANLGLQKTAEISKTEFGSDVQKFVSSDFYVDDGLTSTATPEQAIELMKRTQAALSTYGRLRLHKIASNCDKVMEAFPPEDLAKDLASLDLTKDDLPLQRSLGLSWNLREDCFTFQVSASEKPFTRRGVLSVVNSLYDPLGFVAPVTIVGKSLLKEMTVSNGDWDDPLPEKYFSAWMVWMTSLQSLKKLWIPRTYVSHSLCQASRNELLMFSDASEKAIASVAYIVSFQSDKPKQVGFVMGKAKVAPSRGHSIPRLELCAAVLSVEIADFVPKQLDVTVHNVRYYTDSKVVLGYICNRTRRFHTYVSNRVQRILDSSKSTQWSYVATKKNPADVGTRGVDANQVGDSMWLKGPPEELSLHSLVQVEHPLQNPDEDKEVRTEATIMVTSAKETATPSLGSHRFERFSSWLSLIQAISRLQHVAQSFNKTCDCFGWHLCSRTSLKSNLLGAQNVVVCVVQIEWFKSEIFSLNQGSPVPANSPILSLYPFLDEHGVLRVGGRLRHSDLPTAEKNPIIIPGKSHLAILLIRHFHTKVLHQGRHFTEGAIRAGGFWITNGKRRVSSVIFGCFQCRRLRGKHQNQIMADLPMDRVTQAQPFTYVGVDVFGPWSVVSRRTRGGQASNKRWAVLFTCLSIRAVHIELVEEMSSSAFINALRRFVAIRGNVIEFRSDRGTNFIGATDDLGVHTICVENGSVQRLLQEKQTSWVFNPPHASHMGGVWERMIGVVRRVLDSVLQEHGQKNLTHDVLATFMAEVSAIVNARPIVPVSSDGEAPAILSPSTLLTHKVDPPASFNNKLSLKDIYRNEWKRVQVLSDLFWNRWRSEFLTMLQSRRKWVTEKPNIKVGDVVLMKDKDVCRNQWPLARVVETFPSSDSRVRSVKVKVIREGKPIALVRPITELVLLTGN